MFSKGDYRPERGKWLQDHIDTASRAKVCDREQPATESEYLVKALTHERGLVVDPFLGSGTTGVACKRLDRRFVGCDVDRKAVEISLGRLQKCEPADSSGGADKTGLSAYEHRTES